MQKVIRNKYFGLFLGQLLIIVASLLNTFPKGYILSGGDVAQNFNSSEVIKTLSYTWNAGIFFQNFSYNIFYYPFLLLSNFLRLSPSNQSFLYFFIFLTGSFWSFYFGLKLYKKDIDIKYHIFFSFLYSFNIYVFFGFFSTSGYSPFLFLYVLIPLIFGLTYNFFALQNKINFKTLSLLGLMFFLTNIPNGNMPFFISLNIFLFLFLILLFTFIYGKIINKINFIKKIFFYYAIYYFAVFWSVFPQITELLKMSKKLNNNETFWNIGDWIIWQATKFPNPFFFIADIKSFINNFYFLGYFSLFLFLILLLSIIFGKKQKDILVIIYLFLLLVCIFLANKGNGILDHKIILKIFAENPILASLRSSDKTLIFLPFFVLISTFLNFEKISFKSKGIFVFLLILSLLSVFPFFIGGIQTKYSLGFKNGENYLSAEYSYLHKIPDAYFKVAEFINNKNIDVKILRLPYNVINSIGWVNFPKWKQIGVDPTVQFFNNSTIQMNSFGAFGIWNYGEFWNTQALEESKWILPFSGLLNTSYWIYHKDVDQKFLKQTISKIEFYEQKNFIEVIDKNDYFNLYKINYDYFLPHFYIPQNIIYANGDVEQLVNILVFKDYQIRSMIYLTTETSDINGKKEISRRANEFFIKGELRDRVSEEEFKMIINPEEISLPYVRWKPESLIYPLALTVEKFNKWNVKKDLKKSFEYYLLYGNKRISEIISFNIDQHMDYVLENYKNQMDGAIEVLNKLKQLDNKNFTTLWVKLKGTLLGQEKKIEEFNFPQEIRVKVDDIFEDLNKKTDSLKVKHDFSKLVYQFDIPKEGEYQIYLKNEEEVWEKISTENFKEGKQELVLPVGNISGNLLDKNLRIKSYSPNSLYQISFDYQSSDGGNLSISEGKSGDIAQTTLLPTGKEIRHFEMFFKSSSEVKDGSLHLSVSSVENLKVEWVYQPEIILRSNAKNQISDTGNNIVGTMGAMPKITFMKINPTKYKIRVEGAKEPYNLVFSESFHKGWKAYINNQPSAISNHQSGLISPLVDNNQWFSKGNIVANYFDGDIKEGNHKNIFLDKNTFETWGKKPISEENHLLVNGYANSWYITPKDSNGTENYEIIIEFWPQRLFYIGLGISLTTLLLCLGFLCYNLINGARRRKKSSMGFKKLDFSSPRQYIRGDLEK